MVGGDRVGGRGKIILRADSGPLLIGCAVGHRSDIDIELLRGIGNKKVFGGETDLSNFDFQRIRIEVGTVTIGCRIFSEAVKVHGFAQFVHYRVRRTGEVFVDGKLLDEPYIKNLTINDEGAFDYPITVPEGKYFAMGDNRQGSRDSRDSAVKFIDREDILGKVVLRVFPFDKLGTVK